MASAIPEPLQSFEPASTSLATVLAGIDSLHSRYTVESANGHILANVVEAIRLELTYHSNAIEGNTLSLRDTQIVIEGRTPDGARPLREIYEARNHDRALRMIESWALGRPPGNTHTEKDLLDIHAVVLAEIDPEGAGRLRTERVLITGSHFIPPGPHRFDELMPATLQLANRPTVHPVLQAAELHYNVVAIHPFRDGNGRTSRLLMNYFLLSRGFPLTIIDVAQRGEYLAALDEANSGRWERFGLFITACVENSIRRMIGD